VDATYILSKLIATKLIRTDEPAKTDAIANQVIRDCDSNSQIFAAEKGIR